MKKKALLLLFIVATCNGVIAQNYRYGKVSKEELKESFYPLDSTANAALLYKKREVKIVFNEQDRTFEKKVEVQLRYKIYNEKGFKYGNHAIRFYNPDDGNNDEFYKIKATTYNLVKGKIKKQEVDKKDIVVVENSKYYSTKQIAFPEVKKGSVLEIKYTITSQYFDISTIKIQEDIPVKKMFVTVDIPEYFKYKKISKGYFLLTPKVTILNDFISLTSKTRSDNSTTEFNHHKIPFEKEYSVIEGENIPALKNDEPFTSNYSDYRGAISYELSQINYPDSPIKSYAKSWESVCEKLYDSYSFGKELKKSSYFSNDLKKIITGKETEEAKINAILAFVKSKVQWNHIYSHYTNKGVEKAYKNGEGNIVEVNLILTAMLREAGIRAYPILLSTKGNGIPLFPTLDKSNYVIVGVNNQKGNIVLLDASEFYGTVNVLPARAMNWEGRMLVNKQTNIAIPLVTKDKSEELNVATLVFDKDFNLSGTVQTKLTKRKALHFRNNYNKLSKDKLHGKLGKKYHAQVDSVVIKNKSKVASPIIVSQNVSSDNYCETINGKKYINPMLFFKETSNPFKLEKRKYPVDLINPYKEVSSINFRIPEGYKIVSMPKSFMAKMSNNVGSYKYLINQSDNNFTVMVSKEFNTAMIFVEQYNELRKFYTDVIAKNQEKIVLERIH